MKKNSTKTKSGIQLILLLLAFCVSSSFELLDADKENHALLRSIWQQLDKLGIDVMQDWRSDELTKGRPVIAPLANYSLKIEPNVNLYNDVWVSEFSAWIDEFELNETGIMLAASSDIVGGFREKWNKTSPEKRLFISFARENLEETKKLKPILEASGYTVFTYLSETEMTLDAKRIAFYMTTAGERLVVDTETARFKTGVMAEALMQAKYSSLDEKALRTENTELVKNALAKAGELAFPSYTEIINQYGARMGITPEEARNKLKETYDFDSYENFTAGLKGEIVKQISGATLAKQKTYLDLEEANIALKWCKHGNFGAFGVCNACHLPNTFPVCVPIAQVIK